MIAAVKRAIDKVRKTNMDDYALKTHKQVRNMYSWIDVARQTESVYNNIHNIHNNKNMLSIIKNWKNTGTHGGWIAVFIGMLVFSWLKIVEIITPKHDIQAALNFHINSTINSDDDRDRNGSDDTNDSDDQASAEGTK